MAHALLPVSRGYLVTGTLIAAGLYAMHDRGAVASRAPVAVTAAPAPAPSTPRPMPTLVADEPTDDDDVPAAEPDDDDDVEDVRGHAAIEDIAEFAMVFDVDGTAYLRLSADLRASARGTQRFIGSIDSGAYAVVAPVAASAMPGDLAKWRGRTVLVDGTCRARVVGFAEVSRVSGDPPGTMDYYYSSEDERPAEVPEWTAEAVVEDNVTLAAQLDGCTDGSWARSTDYQPAQIAHATVEPELETTAIADLLAKDDDDDPTQDAWKAQGGDGDWRDAVDVQATTYEHPVTGEKWIFVSAYKAGGCGDPALAQMATYRVSKNGKVRRFADLEYAGETIHDVVDLDGDGQPELVLGGGDSTELVDLKNTNHDSISVSYHSYGCGC